MKTLIVLLGPTGVGKTDLSIGLAQALHTSIVSCDSRQCYREMNIGTAVPSKEQLAAVPHFFVQTISVKDYFNAWQFSEQADEVIKHLFESRDEVVMSGGSMMYIDALCKGIDDIPTISAEVRDDVQLFYDTCGAEAVRDELQRLDPDFYKEVDLQNMKRVLHAIEVCRESGKPYSTLRVNKGRDRSYRIVKIGLNRQREELYERIDMRVDMMMEEGLEEEVRSLMPLHSLNSLNTVGYRELFAYFEGAYDKEEAIRLIKRNTRHYAKKQLTWFRKDEDIAWFHPAEEEKIWSFLREQGIKL